MIYVDQLRDYGHEPPGWHGRRRAQVCWAHMMADTLIELHAMAKRIGLKREWFQGDHYDVTPARRAHAVRLGAEVATSRDLIRLRRRMRQTLPTVGRHPSGASKPHPLKAKRAIGAA